jgi:NAD-specific glutamate dehydrogenase
VPENGWQMRVLSGLMDDFYTQQAALTEAILEAGGKSAKKKKLLIDEWFDSHEDMVGQIAQMIAGLKQEKTVEVEMLTLVSQRLGQLVHRVRA